MLEMFSTMGAGADRIARLDSSHKKRNVSDRELAA